MKTLQMLLLSAFALVVVLSSGAAATAREVAGGEGGPDGVLVPAADCSVTVIGRGEACVPRDCEAACRKQHGGMGACAAEGCSCAVCAKYPPSIAPSSQSIAPSSQQWN